MECVLTPLVIPRIFSDMRYFTADSSSPAAVWAEAVRKCGFYLGIFGLDYGSPERDRPRVSNTELEFLTALEQRRLGRPKPHGSS